MTKTKVSTVAIVVLSVLLAAALASTIVLAAFAFSRSATTTIKFAGGITLTATGIESNGTWGAKALKTDASTTTLSSLSNVTTGVALNQIVLKNEGAQEVAVAVAVKIEKADPSTNLPAKMYSAATIQATTELKDSQVENPNFSSSDVYLGQIQSTTAGNLYWVKIILSSGATANAVQFINTGYDSAAVDALSEKGFKATFYVAAVYNDDNATANLTSAIQGSTFATFTSGDITK